MKPARCVEALGVLEDALRPQRHRRVAGTARRTARTAPRAGRRRPCRGRPAPRAAAAAWRGRRSSWRMQKMQPAGSPATSAIQARSRGSGALRCTRRRSGRRAPRSVASKPCSAAYSAPWRWMTQPISPGCGGRSVNVRVARRAVPGVLERVHGGEDAALVGVGEALEQLLDLQLRARVELGERRARRRGSGGRPGGGRRCGSGRRSTRPSCSRLVEQAAQVAGVEVERRAQVGRGGGGALAELVEHARLGERVLGAQQAGAEHARGGGCRSG